VPIVSEACCVCLRLLQFAQRASAQERAVRECGGERKMHVMSERNEILGTFCPQSCMLMLKPLVRQADAILMTAIRGPARRPVGARLPAYMPIIADGLSWLGIITYAPFALACPTRALPTSPAASQPVPKSCSASRRMPLQRFMDASARIDKNASLPLASRHTLTRLLSGRYYCCYCTSLHCGPALHKSANTTGETWPRRACHTLGSDLHRVQASLPSLTLTEAELPAALAAVACPSARVSC
jgi:hypothetical protein